MAPKKIDTEKDSDPVDVPADSANAKRSSFDVIKEYFQSGRAGIPHQVCGDHVRLAVDLNNDEFEVFIDGLDDDGYHCITVSSLWDIDLPDESSESILSAIKMINDCCVCSIASAFEFDQKLSICTRLGMVQPVHERHVQWALATHVGLVRACVEPLLAIAFRCGSVGEIATLFQRPAVSDMQ